MRRLAAAVLSVVCSSLAAAQVSEVRPGAKVRLDAPGVVADNFVGTVLTRTADTLVVGGPDTAPMSIPVARITMLELSRGKDRSRGALKGTAWGVGITEALGVLTVSSLHGCSSSGGVANCNLPATSSDKQAYLSALAIAGAFYGAVIGALIGSEKWDRFELVQRAAFQVRNGRPEVRISFRP